jgi:hypothetical protein
MSNRNLPLCALAVAALALAAACADAPLLEPIPAAPAGPSLFGAPPPNPESFDGTLDHDFVRIAQENPGFGGLYRDEAGDLVVVMAGAGTMTARLGISLQRLGVDVAAQPVRVVAGQYDFIELDAMTRRVMQVLALDDVVYVDEKANRVGIGVATAAARAAVEHAVGMLGLPSEAVIISDTEPFRPMWLNQKQRPVAGGLRIDLPGGRSCSLGFNVRHPSWPHVHGFVTASHCTNFPYRGPTNTGPVGTPYWQIAPSDFIGTEAYDAPHFPCSQFYPPWTPLRCRWSDAASVSYAPGVDNAFGRIYRTMGFGSNQINVTNPFFFITNESEGGGPPPYPPPTGPHVGDPVHKVGHVTGWTRAVVNRTCVHLNPQRSYFPNFRLLCQYTAHDLDGTDVGEGDSGAPVFSPPSPESYVTLHGILWGGRPGSNEFAFSGMRGIRFENPPPRPPRPDPPMPPRPPRHPGRIVVHHDEHPLGNAGFSVPNTQAARFARNVASFFTGGSTGSFLFYSNNFGLTGTSLKSALQSAGHAVAYSTNPQDFTLHNLQTYDGVWVCGYAEGLNTSVLTQYVHAGGKVYVCGGTGNFGGAVGEAEFWNAFLNNFNLSFAPVYNGITGVMPMGPTPTHEVLFDVTGLYQDHGQSISIVDINNPSGRIIATHASTGQGLIAVWPQ